MTNLEKMMRRHSTSIFPTSLARDPNTLQVSGLTKLELGALIIASGLAVNGTSRGSREDIAEYSINLALTIFDTIKDLSIAASGNPNEEDADHA